jgi:c-di-GMP-binding flagellar brake protein YcgR
MTTIERRRFKRISAVLSEEKIVLIRKGNHSFGAHLVNLSQGGAELEVGNPELDTALEESSLSLFFQRSGQPFEILARPVRWEGQQLAVEFCDLTRSDERDIQMKIVLMEILAARVADC